MGELGQSDPAPLLAPAALGPGALAEVLERIRSPALLAVGPGAVESRAVLERSGARVPGDESELHRVSALSHCRIASRKRPSDPAEVRPAYLRLPDAEINRRRPSA
jgi:hypothetical protein